MDALARTVEGLLMGAIGLVLFAFVMFLLAVIYVKRK